MDSDNKQISESLSYSICCLPPTIPHCHTQDPDLKIETPNSHYKNPQEEGTKICSSANLS